MSDNPFENLSWKCHICDKERPDAKISIRTIPMIINGRKLGSQNIRYCNDDPTCVEKSKTFKFIKDS